MWLIRHKTIVMVVIGVISLNSCLNAQELARLEELRGLAQETPKFPDFQQVHYVDNAKEHIAVVTYFYKSPSSYENVKGFYIRELAAKGWTLEKQEPIVAWWVETGSAITFRKGNYRIIVSSYDRSDWQFSINFSWRAYLT